MVSLDKMLATPFESSPFETSGAIPESVKGLFEKAETPYTVESARLDISIVSALNENPDFEKDILLGKLGADENSELSKRVDLFLNRRDSVKETYEKYDAPAQLFEGLFGQTPKGEIQVERGPFSVNVICFDDSDFKYVAEASYSNKPRGSISSTYGGCVIKNCKESSLDFAVICAKSNDLLSKINDGANTVSTEEVMIHEGQHVFNWLVNNPEDTAIAADFIEKEDFLVELSNLPVAQFTARARDYIVSCKELILEYGYKDELSAHLAQGLTLEQAANGCGIYRYSDRVSAYLKAGTEAISSDQAFLWRGIVDSALADYDQVSFTVLDKCQKLKQHTGITNAELAMMLANTHLHQFINN